MTLCDTVFLSLCSGVPSCCLRSGRYKPAWHSSTNCDGRYGDQVDDDECREVYGSLEYVRARHRYWEWLGRDEWGASHHRLNVRLYAMTSEQFASAILGGILDRAPDDD